MVGLALSDEVVQVIARAAEFGRRGDFRAAIDLLTRANRERRAAAIEQALLEWRREGGASLPGSTAPTFAPVIGQSSGGELSEADPSELSVAALRAGLAHSGCLLVRGLVSPDEVTRLITGIDTAFAAHDAAAEGDASVDGGWYSPCSMPDRSGSGLPERARRRLMRTDGGLVTVDSPRMLFELFELVDAIGIGSLMTEFLGERPLLSANKCTLRRIEPTAAMGGWHQDGAFLGDDVASFNLWLALSDCGRDAPGLDLVPTWIDRVLPSGEDAHFDWSLSDRAVRLAAGATPIIRPEFKAGDALIFDHRLVHRTATSESMTQARYAIESWFFAPSAYPVGQLPLLY